MEAVILFQNLQSNSSVLPVSILSFLMLLGFGAIIFQTGCNPDGDTIGSNGRYNNRQYTGVDRNSVEAPRLLIGSFNIQQLGTKKMSKMGVVSVLVDVTRRFDILAIQELREKDQTVIPKVITLPPRDILSKRFSFTTQPKSN